MEDALISEMGIAILAGANLFKDNSDKAGEGDKILVHMTEIISATGTSGTISTAAVADTVAKAYVMKLDTFGNTVDIETGAAVDGQNVTGLTANTQYLVDYYIEAPTDTQQIDIEPQSFGGNFYLEADTLFRDTAGKDHAAQFIIPNGKIQSNFTFTMASSGDPSTFTFTMDAFPGYVNGVKNKKVLSAIQILGEDTITANLDPAGDFGLIDPTKDPDTVTNAQG